MALNCDFEGIDNDLLVNDPNRSASYGVERKPLDSFTRS